MPSSGPGWACPSPSTLLWHPPTNLSRPSPGPFGGVLALLPELLPSPPSEASGSSSPDLHSALPTPTAPARRCCSPSADKIPNFYFVAQEPPSLAVAINPAPPSSPHTPGPRAHFRPKGYRDP